MKKKCNVVQIKYSGHPHSYSHLYITSDDKIEVGDYYVDKADSSIEFCKERVEAVLAFRFNYCKVIASTDPSLNLPAIPEWFIQEYAEKQTSEVLVEYHSSSNIFVIPHDDKMDQSEIVLHRVKETWTKDEIEFWLVHDVGLLIPLSGVLRVLVAEELLSRLDNVSEKFSQFMKELK